MEKYVQGKGENRGMVSRCEAQRLPHPVAKERQGKVGIIIIAKKRSRRSHPQRRRPARVDVRQHVLGDAVGPAAAVDLGRHRLGRELR